MLLFLLPPKNAAKASDRAKRNARNAKIHQRPPSASDLSLETDFFANSDGSAVTVLEALACGVSGLLLVDQDRGPEMWQTMQSMKGVQPDELALLVIGHFDSALLPEGSHVSFPARIGQAASLVLVAGTLCNFGGKSIVTRHAAQADAFCCQFLAYRDEYEADAWEQLLQAPVRTMAEAFRQVGVARCFSGPWARSSLQGKPCPPASASLVAFHARVDSPYVDDVLRASGHNLVS